MGGRPGGVGDQLGDVLGGGGGDLLELPASSRAWSGWVTSKRLDPDHSKRGVQVQLGHGYGTGGNGGFVKAFIKSRKPEDGVGEDLWMVPMGYYTAPRSSDVRFSRA